MNDLMLDLETLDTTSTAVVLSIGAVFFDTEQLGSRTHINLAPFIASQLLVGRTISAHTIEWWKKQSPDARSIFSEINDGVSLRDQLLDFTDFIKSNSRGEDGDVVVWGNGAGFDNVILASLHEACGLEVPWKFYNNRCFRTLNKLGSAIGVPDTLPRFGIHHNALDDAITQATRAQEIMKCLLSPT